MIGDKVVIKYGRVERIRDTVMKIFGQRVPADVQYWIGRNVENIARAVKPYEEERISIIKQFGIQQIDSGEYLMDLENKQLKALMNKEVEVTIYKIEIEKLSNVNLTQAEIRAIDFMLCEEKLIKVASQIIQ